MGYSSHAAQRWLELYTHHKIALKICGDFLLLLSYTVNPLVNINVISHMNLGESYRCTLRLNRSNSLHKLLYNRQNFFNYLLTSLLKSERIQETVILIYSLLVIKGSKLTWNGCRYLNVNTMQIEDVDKLSVTIS